MAQHRQGGHRGGVHQDQPAAHLRRLRGDLQRDQSAEGVGDQDAVPDAGATAERDDGVRDAAEGGGVGIRGAVTEPGQVDGHRPPRPAERRRDRGPELEGAAKPVHQQERPT
jgi:hypothetical protein